MKPVSAYLIQEFHLFLSLLCIFRLILLRKMVMPTLSDLQQQGEFYVLYSTLVGLLETTREYVSE
jgi:hypothetical protein